MNKFRSLLITVFAGFFSLHLAGCKKCDDYTNPECPNYCIDETDPNCPNYNPCLEEHAVSAAFKMGQDFPPGRNDSLTWRFLDADTVSGWRVRFEALEEAATYEWQIGAGTYTDQVFTLFFDEVQQNNPGATIPITLIVQKTPNNECFPDDDGIDTLTRYLTIMDECSTRLNGRYQGYWLSESPEDTFTITLTLKAEPPTWEDCLQVHYFSNYDKQGCVLRQDGNAHGYTQIYFGHGNWKECDGPVQHMIKGFAWLSGTNKDSLNIDYKLDYIAEEEGDEIVQQFRGVRLN